MPMTWGQVFTAMKNTALMQFQPVTAYMAAITAIIAITIQVNGQANKAALKNH